MLKRIVYPEVSIAWLGLTKSSLNKFLYRRAKLSSSYQNRVITGDLTSDSSEIYSGDVSRLTEGQLYPCCIEAEMTVNELKQNEDRLRQVYGRWSGILADESARLERFFDKHAPSHVILVQGYEPTNWFARAEAIKRGLSMLSLENTALSHKLVWDNCSGIVVNRNAAEGYYWRYWDSVSEADVIAWYSEVEAKTSQFKSNEHASPSGSVLSMGEDKPIVLFLGQVYTDSSILFGSDAWRSPVELMAETLKEVIRMGAVLVVKLHPKEFKGGSPVIDTPYAKLTYRKMLEDPYINEEMEKGENILVDHKNDWGTYELIKMAKCAVTMNSQAGLEAQIRGVATIVCGRSFYGGLGFTYQAPNRDVLALALKDALSVSDCDEWTYKARRFAYIYFEKYCIQKSELSVVKKLLSS